MDKQSEQTLTVRPFAKIVHFVRWNGQGWAFRKATTVQTCLATQPTPHFVGFDLDSAGYFAGIHCPKSNTNFRDITWNWNVEENEILHEIFRVISRFPCYISCYIAKSRLPLRQRTVRHTDYQVIQKRVKTISKFTFKGTFPRDFVPQLGLW